MNELKLHFVIVVSASAVNELDWHRIYLIQAGTFFTPFFLQSNTPTPSKITSKFSFEVLTDVSLEITVFCDVTPCTLLDRY
jgi:hypothetical protein